MQSLSPTAYSDAFSYSDPNATGHLLQRRMAAAKEANERLAHYFSERADAEEAYAKAIQRALASLTAGKTPFDLHSNAALGPASARAVGRVIEHESAEVVRMHQVFARRCRDQLEVPLRSRATKDDWTALQRRERETEALLRDYEDAQHRLQKAQQKASGSLGGKKNAEKLPALQEEVSMQQARWLESAPSYLNAYQHFDFGRLTSIKELLTVYETLQNDLGRERMELAERGLESILTWEVEQDLTEFVSREGFKGGAARAPAHSSGTPNGRQPAPSPLPPVVNVDSPNGEFGQNIQTAPASVTTPMRQRTNTDTQSTRSGRADSFTSSRQGDGRGGGFLSAFKSGGSKLDRRKSTAGQQQQQRQALNGADSDDERDAFRSSGSASLGRPSRDRHQSLRSGGMASDDEDSSRGGGGLKVNSGKNKRSSFMPGFLKRNHTSARRDSFSERQSQQETTPQASGPSMQPRIAPAHTASFSESPLASPLTEPRRPGNNNTFDEMEEISTPTMSPDPPKTSQSLNPFSSSMAGGPAGGTLNAGAASAAASAIIAGERDDRQPRVDEHGYTVPPANYDKPAWQTNTAGDLMDMPDSDEDTQSPQNMRVNIAPATARSGESDAEREAAMQKMKNTLLQNKSSTSSGSVSRRGTRAGGRGSRQSTLGLAPIVTSPGDEVSLQSIVDAHRQDQQQAQERDTAPSSATPSSPNGSFLVASPTAPPVPNIPTPVRAGSMLSTTSSQQQTSGVTSSFGQARNGAGGFRAAILETVNVLFRNGQIERVLVTGSVALSLNTSISGPLKIRIANFERFDKSAPNKTFLHATETPGEFTVDAQALQNSHSPVTTVLKYQVRTDNLNARAFVPIEVNAQWKLEPNQTSFLMTYHGNPECQFASADPSPFGATSPNEDTPRLHDVAFSVPVIGESVANVQSKPTGSYSVEKQRILWKMDDLDMSTSRAAKILARWQVASTAQPQPLSVQWRLPGRLASQTDLQVVDNVDLEFNEIIKSTSSGKYQAH